MVWLNLVMAGMVLIAITPLSAAQIMLLIDRYLVAISSIPRLVDPQFLWMHFFSAAAFNRNSTRRSSTL